jgi:hypothetical protein
LGVAVGGPVGVGVNATTMETVKLVNGTPPAVRSCHLPL